MPCESTQTPHSHSLAHTHSFAHLEAGGRPAECAACVCMCVYTHTPSIEVLAVGLYTTL